MSQPPFSTPERSPPGPIRQKCGPRSGYTVFLTLSESYSGHFPPPPGTQGYSIPDGGSSPAAPLSLFRALYTDPAGGSYFPHRCRPDGAPSRGMRQTPPASSPSPHPPVPVSPDRCFPRIRTEDLLPEA